MMIAPEPGAYVSHYPPTTFPACPDHPFADAISVTMVEVQDGKLAARTESPVCAECGRGLLSVYVPLDAEEVASRAERGIDALAHEFCDRLNEWLAEHDEVGHGGEPCHKERGNMLAYICHRMGYSRETLIVMLDRLKDYDAIHAEHEEGR